MDDIKQQNDVEIVNESSLAEILDKEIFSLISKVLNLVDEDRKRAEQIIEEIREIVISGGADADILREFNKAQENISLTTDQLIRLLGQLAKIKSGDAKIQIAQINGGNNKEESVSTSRIIKALEALEDDSIEIKEEEKVLVEKNETTDNP